LKNQKLNFKHVPKFRQKFLSFILDQNMQFQSN